MANNPYILLTVYPICIICFMIIIVICCYISLVHKKQEAAIIAENTINDVLEREEYPDLLNILGYSYFPKCKFEYVSVLNTSTNCYKGKEIVVHINVNSKLDTKLFGMYNYTKVLLTSPIGVGDSNFIQGLSGFLTEKFMSSDKKKLDMFMEDIMSNETKDTQDKIKDTIEKLRGIDEGILIQILLKEYFKKAKGIKTIPLEFQNKAQNEARKKAKELLDYLHYVANDLQRQVKVSSESCLEYFNIYILYDLSNNLKVEKVEKVYVYSKFEEKENLLKKLILAMKEFNNSGKCKTSYSMGKYKHLKHQLGVFTINHRNKRGKTGGLSTEKEEGGIHMGNNNNYNAPVQINNAKDKATINATQNIDNRKLEGIDIKALQAQLSILKNKLVEKEMYVEAAEIKNAIETKDESKIIGFLKAAGQKTLHLAETTVLPIAVEAIKKAIGAFLGVT